MLRCFFKGHDFERVSIARLGYTTAPYPAVDEWVAVVECSRCGKQETRYAGFIFDGDEEHEQAR
jgi:hypothetical protein